MGEVCLFVGLHIHAWLRPSCWGISTILLEIWGGELRLWWEWGLVVMLVTGVRPSWSVMSPYTNRGQWRRETGWGGDWAHRNLLWQGWVEPRPMAPQGSLQQHRRTGVCAPLPSPSSTSAAPGALQRVFPLRIPDPASPGSSLEPPCRGRLCWTLLPIASPQPCSESRGARAGGTRQLLASWGHFRCMFKGSTAVISAQPGSRASLQKPGWCRLLWAPPCALPLWWGAVAPQPWCLWGGNNSPLAAQLPSACPRQPSSRSWEASALPATVGSQCGCVSQQNSCPPPASPAARTWRRFTRIEHWFAKPLGTWDGSGSSVYLCKQLAQQAVSIHFKQCFFSRSKGNTGLECCL